MYTPRPRLLAAADQHLSDRAARAADDASRELRDRAHSTAHNHAEEEASRPFYYAAYLLLWREGEVLEPDFPVKLHDLAAELEAIHRRHVAATEARKAAG